MAEERKALFVGIAIGIIVVVFVFMPCVLSSQSKHNRINFEQEAITNKVAEYRIINPISAETKFFWITNR